MERPSRGLRDVSAAAAKRCSGLRAHDGRNRLRLAVEQLNRAEPRVETRGRVHGDQLVRVRVIDERGDVGVHFVARADRRVRHHLLELRSGGGFDELVRLLVRERPPLPEEQADAHPLHKPKLLVRPLRRVRSYDGEPGDNVRSRELPGWAELTTVERDRVDEVVRREMRRERVGQTEGCSQLCAKRDEPRMYKGTFAPRPGIAFTPGTRVSSAR